MIVVDTNILAALLLPTPETDNAEAVLVRDPEWFSPPLWRSELRNVLANLIREQRLELAQAFGVMEQAEILLIDREVEPPNLDVLQLSAKTRCTAYDCEFVAVARQLGIPLVTLDRQILRAFPDTAVSLHSFLADYPDLSG